MSYIGMVCGRGREGLDVDVNLLAPTTPPNFPGLPGSRPLLWFSFFILHVPIFRLLTRKVIRAKEMSARGREWWHISRSY